MATEVQTTAAISFPKLQSESIVWAEQMIAKWEPNVSVFHVNRKDARRFLSVILDIKQCMEHGTHSEGSFLREQNLVEAAMDCLKMELAELLLSSDICAVVSDDDRSDGGEESSPAAVVEHLRAIVACMISSGYGQECLETYKQQRRAVVGEGLSRLGFEHMSSFHVQKLTWDSLDFKIKQWLAAAPAVFDEIFTGERFLCDRIFASRPTGDSCFAEITGDAAVQFFSFPQVMASKYLKPQEKIFGFLNMYRKIVELSPKIESVFSTKSTNVVQSQVTASLEKLAETVKSMLAEFERTVHKDSSKSVPHGGGLHALTQSVMNHVALLGDYGDVLAELYADDPLPSHADPSPKPPSPKLISRRLKPVEEEGGDPESGFRSASTARLAWFVTILLCKIDAKAEVCKEAWQSYLFLANNHQHVVNRVKESGNLAKLLGEEWLSAHENKARSFARSFLKLAWRRVLETIPADASVLVEAEGVDAARRRMVQFNKAFEDACKNQVGWVVLDGKVRGEIKSAVERNVVGSYRPFYEMCRAALRVGDGAPLGVRFAPADLLNHLSGLYFPHPESSDWESLPSLRSGKGSRWSRLKESMRLRESM